MTEPYHGRYEEVIRANERNLGDLTTSLLYDIRALLVDLRDRLPAPALEVESNESKLARELIAFGFAPSLERAAQTNRPYAQYRPTHPDWTLTLVFFSCLLPGMVEPITLKERIVFFEVFQEPNGNWMVMCSEAGHPTQEKVVANGYDMANVARHVNLFVNDVLSTRAGLPPFASIATR